MNPAIERLAKLPRRLKEIPDPPQAIFVRGTLPKEELTWLCVVGSRKYTPYGKSICERLVHELRGYPIAIVSGLALGIDAIAHEAALATGLVTVAVPGSGLDDAVLYPRNHLALAKRIIENGGALISEFEPHHKARPEDFPKRNRIMAGLSDAVLIIEAQERSGTLITARLALEYNRDVLAVPGPVHAPTTAGPHHLIRLGATLIRNGNDILDALNLQVKPINETIALTLTDREQAVYDVLETPLSRDDLMERLPMSVSDANVILGTLEIRGIIVEELGVIRRK